MKVLKCYQEGPQEIVAFINKNNIKREDILQIVHDQIGCVYYYAEADSKEEIPKKASWF